MESVLEWALRYAERGWKVIPLHGVIADGACTCWQGANCDSPGKHPLQRDWPTLASDDPAKMEEWFGPEVGTRRNIGVVCGASNLVVIDIDDEGGEGMVQQLFESNSRSFAKVSCVSNPFLIVRCLFTHIRKSAFFSGRNFFLARLNSFGSYLFFKSFSTATESFCFSIKSLQLVQIVVAITL